MRLLDIVVRTGVARAGMTVAEVFDECVANNVPGIPFCNEDDRVVGRVSIRHTLKHICIPEYIVNMAHLLGDDIEHLSASEIQPRRILKMLIDPFVLEDVASVTSASPLIKALAIMERFNSGYIFLIDSDKYQGIVTRMGIAELLLKAVRS
jgi:CBS domain-containing protein